MVKAVAGGGGKGMRVVHDAADLPSAIRAARSEAGAAFGDSAIYLERRLERPRHIEVQLLADQHGTVLPCRRARVLHSAAPSEGDRGDAVAGRARRSSVPVLTAAAAAVAASVGYVNAGTVEFLLDEDGRFYFLEMNTRIQVEHPVTEMVTGVDLVQWQIRIARGERLTLSPERLLTPTGHAIECRVYAEDPDAGFLPSPGRITSLRVPAGPGIRDDGWAETGTDVPIFYDPLDLEADRLGRESAAGDRPDAAGAHGIRGARHPDQPSVFPMDAAPARFPRGAIPYRVSGRALAAPWRRGLFRDRSVPRRGRGDRREHRRERSRVVAGPKGPALPVREGQECRPFRTSRVALRSPEHGRLGRESRVCADDLRGGDSRPAKDNRSPRDRTRVGIHTRRPDTGCERHC